MLSGYRLLAFPSNHRKKRPGTPPEPRADPVRLLACASALRTWYHLVGALPDAEFAHFTGVQWGYFVIAVVLGLRLSFPIPDECPGWDHAAARQILDLGSFLDKFSETPQVGKGGAPAPGSNGTATDVLSAGKVVLGVVKRRYDRRLAALNAAAAAAAPAVDVAQHAPPDVDKALCRCPMLDGSLDEYIRSWDDTFVNAIGSTTLPVGESGTGTGVETAFPSSGAQPVFHDLWATMTMGWSQEGFGDMDFSDI